jgi:hypothetical protein
VLEDGTIQFVVRRPDGTTTEHGVDLLVLKLTCEECQTAHQLAVKDGLMNPTAAFLIDLAGRLAGLGLDGCTPTMAHRAWVTASEQMVRLGESRGEMPN